MRRFMIMGLSLLGVLAVGLMSTTAAMAGNDLVLREGGPHEHLGMDAVLAKNAPLEAIVATPLGECTVSNPFEAGGNLITNASKKDVMVFSAFPWHGSCEGEYEGNRDEVEAVATGITLMRNGRVKLLDAQLGIHVWGAEYPEGCQYFFKIHTATFEVPAPGTAGEAILSATATPFHEGVLKSACRTKPEPSVTITLADNGGYPLETTLEG